MFGRMWNLSLRYEWLAEASDVLYPSAYFNEKLPDERKPAYMDGAVHMARTWLDYIEQPHKPIYVYTSTTLNNHPSPMPYYSDVSNFSSKTKIWFPWKQDKFLSDKHKHSSTPFTNMVQLLSGHGSIMMTSSNGNIFRVTGHLCGEFTGLRWIPRTKASDAELWYFLWCAPN